MLCCLVRFQAGVQRWWDATDRTEASCRHDSGRKPTLAPGPLVAEARLITPRCPDEGTWRVRFSPGVRNMPLPVDPAPGLLIRGSTFDSCRGC